MKAEKNVQFSLIIPCYNVPEEYIRRAFHSVNEQGFSDYEVIVVDDGSKPEFHDVLERVVKECEKASLITTENRGAARARNIGIERAEGEYIVFLDADDMITKNCFQEAFEAIQQTGADIVFGGTRMTDTLDALPELEKLPKVEYELYKGDEIRTLIPHLGCLSKTKSLGGSYLSRGSFSRFVRKTIVKKKLFRPELRIGEDICWNLELLSQCELVCIAKTHWYWYWQNPNSILHRFNPNIHLEFKKCLETIPAVLNLDNDDEYMTYINLILDLIRKVRKSVFTNNKDADPQLLKKIKYSIYCEAPWNKLKESRSFHLCPSRMKVLVMLYRFHLLFFYWDFRNNIHKVSQKHNENGKNRKDEKQ